MTQNEALKLLKEKIQNPNLIKHSLAVEACMKARAEYFDDTKERWALAGLLHDIDYEETKDRPEEHSLRGAKILENLGLDKEIVEAVNTYNEIHNLLPETKMAKALFCVDPLTGLILRQHWFYPIKR